MASSSFAPRETAESAAVIECHKDLASFFYETLRGALASRRIEAPPPTEHYLVDLLSGLGHDEAMLSRSLVELQLAALGPERRARLECLRTLGDQALSVSGLFEAHLGRHGISLAYVTDVGSRAYRTAGQLASTSHAGSERAKAGVFFDLGARFRTYAEVLDDVREATALGTRDDVLSLYERYTKTGSKALLDRLHEHGVLAVAPANEDERDPS